MKIKEILNSTKHRAWNIPSKNWKYYQEWNNVIFLHYQVEIEELKKYVPIELEIDKFENKSWVSVVAFTMEKIRPKMFPSFSPISNFNEINIRTYVRNNHKTGVYFLSIEGGKLLPCKIAKQISELPYRYSKIKRAKNQYESYNSEFNDKLEIEYIIGNEIKQKSELDKWLTERYALFQDANNSINEFDIHHLEWPISEIKLKNLALSYKRFENLIMDEPDKIQYSKGIKVLAWNKIKNKKTGYNTR